MPSAPTAPGVSIIEVPSGIRPVVGVATSITAFIGRAPRGPADEPTVVNGFPDYERLFGGLWLKSPMSFAVRDFYRNGGSQAVIVRVTNNATPATMTLGAGSPPGVSLVLEASSPGAWGANLRAFVEHHPSRPELFSLTIEETTPDGKTVVTAERFVNLSVDPQSATFVPRMLEQRSLLARVAKDSTGKHRVSTERPHASPRALTSPPTLVPATAVGGDDGHNITEQQLTGPGTAQDKKGLYALEKTDLFNLLCIPPFTLEDPPAFTAGLVGDVVAYCEARRAMFIMDPPNTWTDHRRAVAAIGDLHTDSPNAAVFFPRLLENNTLRDNLVEEFVPCGAVAGALARTDAEVGVWRAPAGLDATLRGVVGLSVPLTDAENGLLNPLGVNCLRTFPLVSSVVWGARTRAGADLLGSEWKYIPVRRTALFIEESLYRAGQRYVFSPNDEPLWAEIRLNFGAFMHDLFRQSAFQGKTPREAYLVKCDHETTTQSDIDKGIVNILVGFAPLKPAEFVIIRIQQLVAQTAV